MSVYLIAGIQFILTIASFCIIKFNDLRHLEKDMEELKESHAEIAKQLGTLNSNVSYIRGKIDKE